MTSPADELRAAAEKLRSWAAEEPTAPWGPSAVTQFGPALSELMELAGKHWDDGFLCCEHGADSCSEVVAPTLAVARAINEAAS
ncbi:hypothetical protein [Streptomyces sp. NPDC055243]|uniref:hypothetical protein n=1 Tax=Streptomyces sp. NPDC055243 TaxID=3365720 RepID=UPI0037D2A24F